MAKFETNANAAAVPCGHWIQSKSGSQYLGPLWLWQCFYLLVSCRRNMASLVRRFSWRWAIWQVNILDYLKYISGIRIRIAYFGQFNPTKSETNHHPVGCLAPCNYIEYKVQTTDVNPNKRVSNWVISFPHFTINALTFTPPARLGESGFTLWNTSPYVLIETEELASDILSSCWLNKKRIAYFKTLSRCFLWRPSSLKLEALLVSSWDSPSLLCGMLSSFLEVFLGSSH